MFTAAQIRLLTTALTGLIGLVIVSVGLLLTSAFLLPDSEPAERHPEDVAADQRKAPLPKPATLTAQQQRGKALFTNNCAQCHALTEEIIVGPGLRNVTKRAPSEAWLLKWIRNSSAVVASGDPYAVALFNKFNKAQMTSFPNLTDADIRAILSYIESDANAPEPAYVTCYGPAVARPPRQ